MNDIIGSEMPSWEAGDCESRYIQRHCVQRQSKKRPEQLRQDVVDDSRSHYQQRAARRKDEIPMSLA